MKTRQGSEYTYFNSSGAANLFLFWRKADMSHKRPNSPVKIKNFFSAWAHKQNCILYKHLYGFWEIVNAETRLEEIYFEDFKTSRTFLFLDFTFLIRASNVLKTWCLILQVFQLIRLRQNNNCIFKRRYTPQQSHMSRGNQREYSSKPLKHSIVQRILVFKG